MNSTFFTQDLVNKITIKDETECKSGAIIYLLQKNYGI